MITKCPKCGSKDIGDRWVKGRKLSRYCYDCDWVGLPRVPELWKIKNTREIRVGQFPGFQYEIFDRYGHILVHSRFFDTKTEVKKALMKEMKLGKKDKDAGPYTGILWPSTVTVKGMVYAID